MVADGKRSVTDLGPFNIRRPRLSSRWIIVGGMTMQKQRTTPIGEWLSDHDWPEGFSRHRTAGMASAPLKLRPGVRRLATARLGGDSPTGSALRRHVAHGAT